MAPRILRLVPGPPEESALAGTYLAHGLHARGAPGSSFVYADFVASLDGRIAVRDRATGASRVPPEIASDSDFRLLLELVAQADCLVTHGGYLRAVAAGQLDDILQVGTRTGTGDLAEWRRAHGLAPQPAVVVASASLDFALPPSLEANGRRVLIATGDAAPRDRLAALAARGCETIVAGSGKWVEGGPLARALGERGFRSVFLLAGPRMLETMLRDGVLSRLYLTIAHRIVGGEAFQTLISGPELGSAGDLRLASLHYDAAAPQGSGQFFAAFVPARR